MLQVNTKDYSVTRLDLPQELRGLSQHTLSNLQTELKPVPAHLVNIEFWQEVDASIMPNETQVFDGNESYEIDKTAKTVKVTKALRDKTQDELNADKKAKNAIRVSELKQLLADSDFRMLPDYQERSGKTNEEMEVFKAQRKEWYDELQKLSA
jgi:hypothetical protein